MVGRLWWSEDIKATAEDYLRLIAIEPAEAWGPISFYFPIDQANAASKTVTLLGPSPIATLKLKTTAAEADRARQLWVASYNLLPTEDFLSFRALAPGHLVSEVGAKDTYLVDLTNTGLEAAGFRPVTLTLADAATSAARLTDLGYDQLVGGSAEDPAGHTQGKTSITFVAPEEVTAKPDFPKTAADKRNLLEFSAGVAKGTKYSGAVQYRRKKAGGDNTLAARVQTQEDIPGIDASYQFDYVAFDSLNRRLSVTVEGGRQPAADRQLADQPATEKKDRLDLRSTLEVWRNHGRRADATGGQWLNLELEAGAERSRLANKDSEPDVAELRYDLATLSFKGIYSHSGYGGGLPWTDAIAEIGAANDTGGGGDGYRWSKLSLAHRRLAFGSVRWEGRADLHWTDGDVPVAAQPSFGGDDSVRGFTRDAARGRATWSVKNEIWFRPPAEFGLPKGIATLIRRSMAVALFCDIGGVIQPADHAVQRAASAGLGLRVLQGPVTIRADWAHSIGSSGSLPPSNAGYFTVTFRPTF